MAAPLSAPLFWKFNFSKIWTHMLLYLKTDCSYTHFSFLYVQTSSNIKKMRFYGLIWIIRPSKILLRLQEIAISCNLMHSILICNIYPGEWHGLMASLTHLWVYFRMYLSRQVRRKLLTYFIDLLSLYKRGAERGAHTIHVSCLWVRKCEKMMKMFETVSTLHVSCAHTFPPPFSIMSKVWKYEARGLIGM